MANPPGRTYLRQLHFLGGQTLVTPDNNALTLPAGTTLARISAESGAVYYAINQTGVDPGSHGYVATGDAIDLGPMDNLRSLHVHSAAGTVRVTYWKGA